MEDETHRQNPTPTVDLQAQNRSIIADDRRAWLLVAAVAAVAGAFVAAHYWRLGLTLSHYDAKGHLVVARRILDGINPGWVQIGAVWLPLPHLLNMVPVQVDAWYRTGLSGVVMSVLAFGLTAGLLFRIVHVQTASAFAALTAAIVFAASPDVLYLQSTPMTEPLLLLLVTASVWTVMRAVAPGAPDGAVRWAGICVAGACMTRYEAWPVSAALLTFAVMAPWHQGVPFRDALKRVTAIAVYPAWAIAAFLVLSRASTGAWFTTSGFFVPENIATGRPLKALLSTWWGAHELTSYALASLALAGLLATVAVGVVSRRRSLIVLPLALAAAGALPAYAFYSGHPFRIRYMVPLVPVVGLGLGMLVGLARGRWRVLVGAIAWVAILMGPRPLSTTAPMVLEAQWDVPHRHAREAVTVYLRQHWDHEMVLASMGSLAHYMQELSAAGFEIRDFLHEGNGFIWDAALEHPGAHVRWVLVEEQAEGGDMIAQRARSRPRYLAGFERVAEGGGVVLYHRSASSLEAHLDR